MASSPLPAGSFALFSEELEGVLRAWEGGDLEISSPEFAEHREVLAMLDEVRARVGRLVPRARHKSGQHPGVVLKFDRGRGVTVAQLDSGEFVPFHLTAYMGRRGARYPQRGTRVRVTFTEHEGQGVVLAVEDDGG